MAEDSEGRPEPAARHRAATWLAWWVLLMSLWVAVDDSLQSDELLAGAGASAIAALAAEIASHQAATRLEIRAGWLARAFRLPGEVAHDTRTVFAALARTLATRRPPRGGFRELPVRYGDDTPLGVTRRVLLTGAYSLAPNKFVLGMDEERDVMVVHELVTAR
jgi:multisubunit Na+/H+ antiporter MnhE subunit